MSDSILPNRIRGRGCKGFRIDQEPGSPGHTKGPSAELNQKSVIHGTYSWVQGDVNLYMYETHPVDLHSRFEVQGPMMFDDGRMRSFQNVDQRDLQPKIINNSGSRKDNQGVGTAYSKGSGIPSAEINPFSWRCMPRSLGALGTRVVVYYAVHLLLQPPREELSWILSPNFPEPTLRLVRY